MALNGNWQKAFIGLAGLVLGVVLGIQGWAIDTVLEIDKDIAAIKENRFTDEDGAKLELELQKKADRSEIPSRDYLEERFKRLEEKLDRLEEAVK